MMIDDRRGGDRQKLRLELVAFANVERHDLVGDRSLLEKDRYLVPIRRGPVVEINHRLTLTSLGDPSVILFKSGAFNELDIQVGTTLTAKQLLSVIEPLPTQARRC